MTSGRLISLILKLSFPNTIGLLVVAAYSLADSFFVSSLGTAAGAAVGITFSLHVLIQAIGYTLGMGAGSLLSRALGKRDVETASRYVGTAFLLSVAIGITITGVGSALRDPLLLFLGAKGDVLPLARAYVRPFLFAAPVMCASYVLSQTLRAEGKAFYSMIGLSAGSALNIVLDPLLITRFGMGIAGASTATLISQYVSLCVLLSAYFFHNSSLLPFRFLSSRFFFDLRRNFCGGTSIALSSRIVGDRDHSVQSHSLRFWWRCHRYRNVTRIPYLYTCFQLLSRYRTKYDARCRV